MQTVASMTVLAHTRLLLQVSRLHSGGAAAQVTHGEPVNFPPRSDDGESSPS